ncbi:ENR1 protein, partial [Calyptomena viridis]|nr:ENR1 protein [Calyptomena viridis]
NLKEELKFPILGKILFVNLATEIVKELNVSNCWVCGGPLISEEWPWKGKSLSAFDIVRWNRTVTSKVVRPEGWVLS